MSAPGPTLRLVLGDQLNPLHSWLSEVRTSISTYTTSVRTSLNQLCKGFS